jgi:hypothetical protein
MGVLDRFRINTRRENLSPLYMAAFIVFIIGGFCFLYYQRFVNDAGLYRSEYDGVVVEKPVFFRDTEQGAGVQRLLTIEDNNKTRFNVIATKDVYDQAQIGMHIKRTKDGTTISYDK